jgi:hypothetical protein
MVLAIDYTIATSFGADSTAAILVAVLGSGTGAFGLGVLQS